MANARALTPTSREGRGASPTTATGPLAPAAFTRARRTGSVVGLALPVVLGVAGIALLALGALATGAVLLAVALLVLVGGATLGSPKRLVASLEARPADESEDARLLNLVEGLCVANGIVMPKVHVLNSEAMNAAVFAAGRTSALIVTDTLCARLGRIELEGVLAHELAELKRGDAAVLARLRVGLGLLAVVFPPGSRLMSLLVEAGQKSLADQAAVAMTRYPPGLQSALDKLADVPVEPAGLTGATKRLGALSWFVPIDGPRPSTTRRGELSIVERAELLGEL